MKLSSLKCGKSAQVASVLCDDMIKYRLIDMGLAENSTVTCLMKNLGGTSFAYRVGDIVIAIRREDAELINVFS